METAAIFNAHVRDNLTHLKDERLVPWSLWHRVNLAASQTDLVLLLIAGETINGMALPVAMNLKGLSVSGGAVCTAGTATFTIWKNGVTTSQSVVINSTTATSHAYSGAFSVACAAGDVITVRVTTSGTFAPTTTEYVATVWLG